MVNEKPISEVFDLIATIGLKEHADPLSKYLEGWRYRVDEHWFIVVNGTKESIKYGKSKIPIPPVNCWVEFNGWPAGLFDPFGGIMAAGSMANEDSFINALKRRIRGYSSRDEVTDKNGN